MCCQKLPTHLRSSFVIFFFGKLILLFFWVKCSSRKSEKTSCCFLSKEHFYVWDQKKTKKETFFFLKAERKQKKVETFGGIQQNKHLFHLTLNAFFGKRMLNFFFFNLYLNLNNPLREVLVGNEKKEVKHFWKRKKNTDRRVSFHAWEKTDKSF